MNKKLIISLLSILIIAGVCAGAYFVFRDNDKDDDTLILETLPDFEKETSATQEVTQAPTDSSDLNSETVLATQPDSEQADKITSDNTQDITTSTFSVEKIIDHTTDREVKPRVVFGTGFKADENYIKFDSQGTFEMYLSYYLDDTTKGTYTLYDDFIYVEYENGKSAEYNVVKSTDGVISCIIVNYGDYDIYFS